MTQYRKAAENEIEHYKTKWDECTIVTTGQPYRQQKGSGRAECIALIKDGMKVGAWTKLCAKKGFDPNFAISSLNKHRQGSTAAWTLKAPEGKTLEQIKSQREERKLSPEQIAKREAKKAEREKRQQERAAAKEAREQAKAAKKAEQEANKNKAVSQVTQKPGQGIPATGKPQPAKGKKAA